MAPPGRVERRGGAQRPGGGGSARALALLACAVALAAAPGRPRAADRPWYVPDRVKLQLAGNVGFLSPGAGWAFAGDRLEGDVFLGWVPRAVIDDDDILSLTGKLSWLPWTVELGRRWVLRPATLALQVTYTFGDEYYVLLPDRYPAGYHDFPTALRAGLAVGAGVSRRSRGALRELGVYAELVALDAMLVSWARNRDGLGPTDVFSLALGVRGAL
jgi:hypothetical protein